MDCPPNCPGYWIQREIQTLTHQWSEILRRNIPEHGMNLLAKYYSEEITNLTNRYEAHHHGANIQLPAAI